MSGIPTSIGSFGLWKFATAGAAVVALVIGFFLLTSTMENKRLTKERDKLSLSITDPKTGYIVRLAQSRQNVIVLEEAIKTQNAAFERQSAAGKAELARLKKELAAAQARTRDAERRLSTFMATKPQGNTLEERVLDVDKRILEDLNR